MLAYNRPRLVILDDEALFLNNLYDHLHEHYTSAVQINKFSQHEAFLDYLRNYSTTYDSPEDILSAYYNSDHTIADAEYALTSLLKQPSICVIDHNLGNDDVDGAKLAETIRSINPRNKVILLTSYLDHESANDLQNDSVIDSFIRKDRDDFAEYLTSLLDKQITAHEKGFYFDELTAFSSADINILSKTYERSKKHLLNNINYDAYLTVNINGDLLTIEQLDNFKLFQFEESLNIFVENNDAR